mgnify:CR=1 FL=1
MSDKIIVYTDGGSRGNPGSAAIGVVIYDGTGHLLKSYGKAIGIATNNEAEYGAVIFALQKVKALLGGEKIKKIQCEVRMDSELVCRQLNGGYKIEQERLFPLFIKIWNLRIDFGPSPRRPALRRMLRQDESGLWSREGGSLVFVHVPREQNREADAQVNQALDREQQNLFTR